MALTKGSIAQLYQKRADWYNVSANAYYILGFREFAYRKKAVRALELHPGDTVVELGCGTGLNFELLRRQIGPQGRIVGVDLTEKMLEKANQRIQRNQWSNVSLVQSDAALYEFPRPVNGIISTFALTLVPEYDAVIRRAAKALVPGGRMVILDFKMPAGWPMWLIRTFAQLTRPFGVTMDLGERHLWESIGHHLDMVAFEELYFGSIYICAGRAAE